MPGAPNLGRRVFTVGHSNQPLDSFLDLLGRQGINLVVDVRSSPYSQYTTHFNRESLQAAVEMRKVRYQFLGDLLGGRPSRSEFYDEEGFVRYDRLARSLTFQDGIRRLATLIQRNCVVLVCSEEDPSQCHRRLLIGRVLAEQGVEVLHLRGDGRVESEAEVARAETFRRTRGQKTLFDLEGPDKWKSTRSVLPRKTPQNSSGPFAEPESGD